MNLKKTLSILAVAAVTLPGIAAAGRNENQFDYALEAQKAQTVVVGTASGSDRKPAADDNSTISFPAPDRN